MTNTTGVLGVVIVGALALGCGGSQREPDGPSGAASQARPAEAEPLTEALTGAITAEQLQHVLGRSAGEFLSLVELEAQAEGGDFSGWRITRLPSTQPDWLDVRTGDVVTAVNGLPVERPEDAQQIWEMLRVASEVRIDLLRQGEQRSVRIPVVDGPGEAPATGSPDERRGPEE